jgi:hypothetical protein
MYRKNFDRDPSLKPCIARAVNFAHAARADGREDFVGAESFA